MSVWQITRNFREDFYALVQQIPRGRVSTYGKLAEALGDKRASRAVGKMLNENPRPILVPCHRVVMSDGRIGGFGMGIEKKRELLADEDVYIEEEHVIDFEEKLFDDFKSDHPLKKLRGYQDKLVPRIECRDKQEEYSIVGGIDASFLDDFGFASISIWDDNEESFTLTIKERVHFPYIPTYLGFREIPLMLKAINELDEKPDVLMVDGNGILHPKGIGLATQLGIEADIPTVGVAKSLLCGTLEHDVSHEDPVSKIIFNGDIVGYAYLSSKRAKNPIYISHGHLISPKTALELIKKYCDYKIPSPIRKAHISATEFRNKMKEEI